MNVFFHAQVLLHVDKAPVNSLPTAFIFIQKAREMSVKTTAAKREVVSSASPLHSSAVTEQRNSK